MKEILYTKREEIVLGSLIAGELSVMASTCHIDQDAIQCIGHWCVSADINGALWGIIRVSGLIFTV